MEFCSIKIDGLSEPMEVPYGQTLIDLSKKAFGEKSDEMVLAVYNGKLSELTSQVKADGEVKFLSVQSKDGERAYRRSVVFLMHKALHDIFPGEKPTVFVQFSLGEGYYCTLGQGKKVTKKLLSELKKRMKQLAELDLPVKKSVYPTSEARELFAEAGMPDKEKLLHYRSNSSTNVYEIDGVLDYFYGYMVPSTRYIKKFDLVPFDEGFVLQFPGKDGSVAEFNPPKKLFSVLKRTRQWANAMDIDTVGALNDAISAGRTKEIVLMQEAFMEERIGALAQEIASDKSRKFIMIAGPSSSGKTTFSKRLAIQLRARGLTPHAVSLDNFYLNRDQMPLDENGEKDFEALEGLDIELFNDDMTKLLNGEKVILPIFDFTAGKRSAEGIPMQLGKNDVLVLEGIHGLNDALSYTLPKESKYKIYISALTQLSIDEHNPLSTTDGRLIRRIVRDARTRGTSAEETIAMWDSVHRGEKKNIFPFQESADAMFNSALIYEMAVLKVYAQPQLYAIKDDSPQYSEAKRLLKLLDYFLPMPTDYIANTSLIREFIGGSCFKA
ncbi:MAG TPA: nucleoside kinase [Lachnospiraceae bacterium]|nr:nucleoside kinase [Lachnospiraceae bacterium]MDD7665177.1 nucleoside kinase [Lachnospiraceae bacterium]MDY4165063.1 nucleoside kinase [Lachnospiraceae bacterium]HAP02764.1 nucleoside kinase [Lachnospiraceae bacterium]